MTSDYIQLKENLETLKLFEISSKLDDTIDLVSSKDISFTEGLLKLTNVELDHRKESAIRAMVKVRAFPYIKELKDFDFEFLVLCQEKVQIKCNQFSLFLKKFNLLFLLHSFPCF